MEKEDELRDKRQEILLRRATNTDESCCEQKLLQSQSEYRREKHASNVICERIEQAKSADWLARPLHFLN